MKVLFTGGGTGGHFFPILAIAEALQEEADKKNILKLELFFASDNPYDQKLLDEYNIEFKKTTSGKLRRYFSINNFFDIFKTIYGLIEGFFVVFSVFPDVVFSKGGHGSVPSVMAARILGIPVFVHESDSAPGKSNLWASKFAKRIAVSFPQATEYFPKEKTAFTGHPIRSGLTRPLEQGAHEYLNLEKETPILLILGGSQGAAKINQAVIDVLPKLIEEFQIIHQVGEKNIKEIQDLAEVTLKDNIHAHRYQPFGFLNDLSERMAAGVADLVISRAGSTIFEIAAWGQPSIIIPLSNSNLDHQRKNAANYARAGACMVIDEDNLKSDILLYELKNIMKNEEKRKEMAKNAKSFFKEGADKKIAKEMIRLIFKK